MNKELKELINDYIKAYKVWSKKDNPTSYEFTCMQSPAINIRTMLKLDLHITYSELYEWCLEQKKADKEDLVVDNKENQLNEKLDEKIEEKVLKLDDNLSFNLFDNV